MMMKCIYCLEDKPETSYRKTEHVIPQSFGVFKNNFTLNQVVCDDCNKYFGDNLEIDLARDTYEGHSRFEFNVKKPNDYKSYGKNSRIIIRVAEGPLKGTYAYREYSPDSNEIVPKPIPQVGFKKLDSDEYEYYLLDEIPDKEYLEKNNFDLKHTQAIKAFGIDVNQLEQKLSERGISFKLGGEVVPPDKSQDLLCEVEGTIDRKIFCAIAKIGFNYLAYWQGSDFMLNESFDITRRFIRYGEKPAYPLVRVLEKAILADENDKIRRLGHLVTVNWADDGVSIVSQVSLFNWITYSISLSRGYSGKRKDIKKGHFFNTNSKEILELETR
ncbi:MAG: hypothetical protein NTU69_12510 [Proteobacteria bacterium]|jgi:hypothetical protein|nr:hypothetical protein [Pseudomonadota bacterium]